MLTFNKRIFVIFTVIATLSLDAADRFSDHFEERELEYLRESVKKLEQIVHKLDNMSNSDNDMANYLKSSAKCLEGVLNSLEKQTASLSKTSQKLDNIDAKVNVLHEWATYEDPLLYPRSGITQQ